MRFIIATLLFGLTMVTAPAAGDDKAVQVFAGTYDWNDGGSDELRAEFKRAKDGTWKVKFDFRFAGKRNSWNGTAEGSLQDGGKISGTAGWSGRTWVFEGTMEAGVLRGSHTEIQRGGGRYDTGSFEMKR